ncbi:DNA uptake protein ComE-like DNA-binding protein [Flavobacterium tiangeerense]|uniref:DNA uptake protein ComE-like DNA-binding protein n=1 Tax=Flavobacterium tiangeerense TaxID=459471 RepID=A0ABY3FP96_9FLAO|nr:helix-hairpin-helix domain-containing protein [Flavobacterium tiangeerense]TWI03349.1 DNA uptake protein ComE-like DNA-binding protein [Flavobacterium tiangeerense]
MNFKAFESFLKFNKEQRFGIIALFTIIIFLQICYYCYDFSTTIKQSPQELQWIALQSTLDYEKNVTENLPKQQYAFNPNFISDYIGYKLGMSTQEIDRLLAFRKQNKFVNSPEEFQRVTQISDSLLETMSPLFKFPNWVEYKKGTSPYKEYKNQEYQAFAKKEKVSVLDINQADKEGLMKVYGIGDAISTRILKQKETLGGFVSMEQMDEIWGLSPEVLEKLNIHFKVGTLPNIKKVDINNASLKELSTFHYFRYALAKEIVTYRSMNGNIKNIEDLTKIKGFPVDKAKIIALYLDFK